MHHFIFPTKDSWISSGSNKTTGVTEADQNFGQDEILEIKKVFNNSSFDYQTRALVQFDLSDISKSIVEGSISSPKYYLRLYEAIGNQELSAEYKLTAYPLSQSWDEGIGKFGDSPKVTDGVSWDNRDNIVGASTNTWQHSGTSYISSSGNASSQSFSYESPDINMNVTDIVDKWLDGTNNNYGFLLKFSGSNENANLTFASSSETDDVTHGNLKFFSSQTHTIYAPKLEVRWDDHISATNDNTGSLTQVTVDGTTDNYLYMKNLKESYKETDKVKIRVGVRKQYIQKTFSTSVQTASGSFIPEGSGSYSIVDMATGETIIPFSDYTKLSCDPTSNYFIQWFNGFYPDRAYKILFKLKYDDSQEQIFDNNFEFNVKR
jgi:hypothetical protein